MPLGNKPEAIVVRKKKNTLVGILGRNQTQKGSPSSMGRRESQISKILIYTLQILTLESKCGGQAAVGRLVLALVLLLTAG